MPKSSNLKCGNINDTKSICIGHTYIKLSTVLVTQRWICSIFPAETLVIGSVCMNNIQKIDLISDLNKSEHVSTPMRKYALKNSNSL